MRIRDGSVLMLGFLAPLVLAFIFYFVFGGAFSGQLDLSVGTVDLDQSEISTGLLSALDALESEGVAQLSEYDDVASAEAAIEEGEVGGVIVFADGFGSTVQGGGRPQLEVVADASSPNAGAVVESIANGLMRSVDSTRLLAAASSQSGPPLLELSGGAVLSEAATDTETLSAGSFMMAGQAAFFVFFTVSFGVNGLLEERRQGTLPRILAGPVPGWAVPVAKALVAALLGVGATLLLLFVSTFIMDTNFGSPVGVVLLVVSLVATGVALMGVVAAFASSPDTANNMQSIIAVVLGMLGGVWFSFGDSWLSNVTRLTPHHWFVTGLEASVSEGTWTAALPAIGFLWLFTAVVGAISVVLLRRREGI